MSLPYSPFSLFPLSPKLWLPVRVRVCGLMGMATEVMQVDRPMGRRSVKLGTVDVFLLWEGAVMIAIKVTVIYSVSCSGKSGTNSPKTSIPVPLMNSSTPNCYEVVRWKSAFILIWKFFSLLKLSNSYQCVIHCRESRYPKIYTGDVFNGSDNS